MREDRKPWVRGAATLLVVGIAAVALIASPVGAASSVKKIATKIAKRLIAADNNTAEGIFVGSKAGPVAFTSETTVAEMTLPGGSYGLTAKAQVLWTASVEGTTHVTCRLLAGGTEVDSTIVSIGNPSPRNAAATLVAGHTFSAGGSVSVRCSSIFNAEARNIRILAVRGPAVRSLPA